MNAPDPNEGEDIQPAGPYERSRQTLHLNGVAAKCHIILNPDISAESPMNTDAVAAREILRQEMIHWLEAQGRTVVTVEEGIGIVVQRAKAEILAHVAEGIVLVTVASFSELHDHVDANWYGGAFDWPSLPSEDGSDAYQDEFMRFWNAVQNTIHYWIVSGRMREEAAQAGA